MFGSSITRAAGLGGGTLLALGLLAGAASAGGNHGEPPPVYEQPPVYQDNYTGPPVIRHIPGLRILFGDSAQNEDPSSQINDNKKKKKKIDESYYEPQPAPAKPKTASKPPATAATGTTATTTTTEKPASPGNPALPQKTASATPVKPADGGPLTCEKATEVVSGFGFSSVEASSCTGKLYAFNAKRGGKTFAIKLDPASGHLTEVKKLP